MGSLSPVHWLLVALVILLLFGPSRLAAIGRDVGQGIRSFKKGVNDEEPAPNRGDQVDVPPPEQAQSASRKPSGLHPN